MGYYTRYKLEFHGPEEHIDKVVANLEFLKEDAEMAKEFGFQYDWEAEALYDIWTGRADIMTFYHHEEPLRALSKQHPDVLFVLSGEGEEAGDIWKEYFKDGKMRLRVHGCCRAEIVYPEYDEAKLA